MRYRHGEALYAIQVENPEACQSGVAWVELDGQRLDDGVILLERGLVQHQVLVRMGHRQQSALDERHLSLLNGGSPQPEPELPGAGLARAAHR